MEISRRPSGTHRARRIKRMELVTVEESTFESLETSERHMWTM